MFLTRLSVPFAIWLITCSPVLAASAAFTCPDGHGIAASTGNDCSGSGCGCSTETTGDKTLITCSDGAGNGATAACDGSSTTWGSGQAIANNTSGSGQAGASIHKPSGAITKPISAGTQQSGTVTKHPPTAGDAAKPTGEKR